MASDAGSDGRKPPAAALRPPLDQALKCPRCDSSNTKFCYYNNYSLTQPRHFCKTCRRYWTKGGALRNVPIGGGCRKNKKSKGGGCRLAADPKESESGGLKFLHGMDYQFGGSGGLPFSRLQSPSGGVFNQFFSFGDLSSTVTGPTSTTPAACASALEPAGVLNSLMGFNYPGMSVLRQGENNSVYSGGETSSASIRSNIAASIESLSSLNQDLHWKLQQQRLATLMEGEKHSSTAASFMEAQHSQALPTSVFQATKSLGTGNSDLRKVAVGDNPSHDWFLQTYAGNGGSSSSSNNSSSWTEIQTWNELHQYSALP